MSNLAGESGLSAAEPLNSVEDFYGDVLGRPSVGGSGRGRVRPSNGAADALNIGASTTSKASASSATSRTLRLHKAARQGKLDVVQRVLAGEGGRLVDALDDSGRSALHWAARKRRRAVAAALLRAGANPNLSDHEGITPLHLAAIAGTEVADIDHGVSDSCMSRHADAEHGRDEAPLRQRFGSGRQLDFSGAGSAALGVRPSSPLSPDPTAALLPGAVASRESSGPLLLSASRSWSKMDDRPRGVVSPRERSPHRAVSPVGVAVSRSICSSSSCSSSRLVHCSTHRDSSRVTLLRALDALDAGPLAAATASPGRLGRPSPARHRYQQQQQQQALHDRRTTPPAVPLANSWLLNDQDDAGGGDISGQPLLDSSDSLASATKNVHGVDSSHIHTPLASVGGENSAWTSPATPKLQVAASPSRGGGVLELLVQSGSVLDAQDQHRRTPLHWAAWKGKVDSAAALLHYGASTSLKDRDGRTPLHLVAISGQSPMVSECRTTPPPLTHAHAHTHHSRHHHRTYYLTIRSPIIFIFII